MIRILFENNCWIDIKTYDDKEDFIKAIETKQDWVYLWDSGMYINLDKVQYVLTKIEEK